MDKKYIVPIVVVAVVGVAAVLFFLRPPKPASVPTNPQQGTFDPHHPNFVLGEIVSVSSEKIELKSGPDTLTATLTAQTKLIKQVGDAKTGIKNVDAKISDFKAKSRIVVYFSKDPVNKVYQADQVQLITQ